MISTAAKIEDLTLNITEEIHVRAPLDVTFAALLEQLGPYNQVAEDRPLPMKLEPWPGGRWFRDLGDNNGHFWGHVQAIKRPTLLEISGPLIMSYPVFNNLQYRLSEVDGGTLIKFTHTAFGLIREGDRHVSSGWSYTHARLKERVEAHQAERAAGQRI
jgi:Activator of Hsp90 ATPase homolog 1-like protein